MKSLNILNDEERENKGLDTSLRFEYQIDWAIYHSLDKILTDQEFVVFVEFHEDVLFADDYNCSSSIKFELFQIKTTYKSYTSKSIVTPQKGSNSVLGKMILGIKGKTFEKQVKNLCLLCLQDINLKNKIKDINTYHRFSEINEEDKILIKDEIQKELDVSINSHYENIISFRKTGLALDKSDDQVKHKILDFIEKKYGEVSSNPKSIYRVLKDDLRPKSEHKNKYEYWEDCIKYRGLESTKISKHILQKVDLNIDKNLESLIQSSGSLLGISPIKLQRILAKIRSYYLFRISTKNAAQQMELDKFIEKIESETNLDIDEEDTYKKAILFVDSEANKSTFLSEYNKMQAVAIYEVFRMILDYG